MISNLNVLKKMLIIGVLTLLAFVAIGTIFLINEKNILISEKKAKLVNIVEIPFSLVENEYKAFQDGKIDEKTAKDMEKKYKDQAKWMEGIMGRFWEYINNASKKYNVPSDVLAKIFLKERKIKTPLK